MIWAMDVTNAYKFTWFGDTDVTNPCQFIGFGGLGPAVRGPFNLGDCSVSGQTPGGGTLWGSGWADFSVLVRPDLL